MFANILSYCRDCCQRLFCERDGGCAAITDCGAGGESMVCGIGGPCKTLADAPEGSSWKIRCLTCQGAVRQRLLDIGFIPGAKITMIRSAPLLDPIEVGVGSGYVALRRSEAAGVHVVEI